MGVSFLLSPRFLGLLSVTESVALPACKGVHHVRASNTYIAAAPNYASPLLGMPIATGGPAHYWGPRGLWALDAPLHKVRSHRTSAGEHWPVEVRGAGMDRRRVKAAAL